MITSVAILGATGYTGAELIRLIERHPHLEVRHVSAHSQAGKPLHATLPGIAGPASELMLASVDDALPDDVELVFTALPHGAAAKSVKQALDADKHVVDLSADFRHHDTDNYEAAYGKPHPFPDLLDSAVYGITEFARTRLGGARLVANPGCYPTCILLPLVPLLASGLLETENIIVDAKSGASGAGRKVQTDFIFCEVNEGLRSYGLPRHRHAWEIEEWADNLSGRAAHIRFTPHLIPMTRGMLATLHLRGKDPRAWHNILEQNFAHDPFVRVLPYGQLPGTKSVAGSNRCDIGIVAISENEAVVISCLDNLLKGAAGQAIQNANAVFGWDETEGLDINATWP
ncbi:MAG TPA: N-acetyl-gamma-glutamyl-phosphate reductase [Mariprofundaceae bacterium]|nr:N-acetyl-gamma-glutamyl-phosphate reductase [Mariprofundaceae bacterium]